VSARYLRFASYVVRYGVTGLAVVAIDATQEQLGWVVAILCIVPLTMLAGVGAYEVSDELRLRAKVEARREAQSAYQDES
jgi:predicted membrane-bound mannosyltransferase